MKTTHEQSTHADEWRSCAGQVHGLVRRLRWRRRAHIARQTLSVLFVAIVPVTLCYAGTVRLFLTSQIELKTAAAPCGYYEDEMRAFYFDKTRSDLPSDLWVHISHCPDCGRDLMFYGGIARCARDHRPATKQSAAVQHEPEQAVSLMRIYAEGTLAVKN
jgi:hypothetical protein